MSVYKRCAHQDRARDNSEHVWWSKVIAGGRRVRVSLEAYFEVPRRGRGAKTLACELDEKLRELVTTGEHFRCHPADGAAPDISRFTQSRTLAVLQGKRRGSRQGHPPTGVQECKGCRMALWILNKPG